MLTQGRGHFWPQSNNLNNLGRDPLGEALYQISNSQAFWFQIRRFLKVSLYKYVKHVSLWASWPQGNNLNNLGRGPLGEAMYQISNAQAFSFQIRRFFKIFSIKGYVKYVGPGAGPFLAPGQ